MSASIFDLPQLAGRQIACATPWDTNDKVNKLALLQLHVTAKQSVGARPGE